MGRRGRADGKDTVGSLIQSFSCLNETNFETLKDYILYQLSISGVVPVNGYPKYKIMKFAQKVKDIATIITGIEDWESGDRDEVVPLFGITRREILQKVGTDCMRDNLDKDVWVKALFNDIEPFIKREDKIGVIITDVRFPNEVQAIKENDGILIKVTRPGYNGDSHISERALDNFNDYDHYIQNNYEYKELIDQVYEFVKQNLIKYEAGTS